MALCDALLKADAESAAGLGSEHPNSVWGKGEDLVTSVLSLTSFTKRKAT